ncbi:Uncharacterised protein [uncultured archaeon]|nr:Uncharacterised protein [uncultured archaeon]
MKMESEDIDGVVVRSVVYELDDIVDGIEGYWTAISNNMDKERIKEMVKLFYKKACESVIMDNDHFVWPMDFRRGRRIISLEVNNVNRGDRENCYGTPVYLPVLHLGVAGYKETMFLGETLELFNKEISNNHHY